MADILFDLIVFRNGTPVFEQAKDLVPIFQNSPATVTMACAAWQLAPQLDVCTAICPNTDLAGTGVKFAFYIQSVFNAMLVIFCPAEGASGAWASTLLTGALVIPATIQLFQHDLTLYHANVVLLFATLSTVTSLAVAPIIPIWRQSVPEERGHIRTRAWREPSMSSIELTQEEHDRRTGRLVLAAALLCQLMLQWTWCIFVWSLPGNFSGSCSGETRFVWSTQAKDTKHLAWSLWLVLCLGITLGWAITMAYSCHSQVHDLPFMISMYDLDAPVDQTSPAYYRLYMWFRTLPGRVFYHDTVIDARNEDYFISRINIRISQLVGLICFGGYLTMLEFQINFNKDKTYGLENTMAGFSQFAALLLAMTPAWPLAVAFMERSNRRAQRRNASSHSRSLNINRSYSDFGLPHDPQQRSPGHLISTFSTGSTGLPVIVVDEYGTQSGPSTGVEMSERDTLLTR